MVKNHYIYTKIPRCALAHQGIDKLIINCFCLERVY